ncbi:uncharacterized protein ACNLHF_023424 isoform 1-T1 [Anomaloglossus baeobatrachus]
MATGPRFPVIADRTHRSGGVSVHLRQWCSTSIRMQKRNFRLRGLISVEKHETRKYEYEAEIALERSQADYMPQEEEEEFLRQASPKKKMNIFLRMKTASSEWSMFLFSFFFLALFSLIMFIV